MTVEARLRDLRPGDAGWILMRHAELYAVQDGFDHSFEPLVARILADFLDHRDPETDRGWIAEGPDGRRLGCIFVVRLDPDTAKLRLFLVEPEARGAGVGQALLDALIAHATGLGFRRISLWTHESHRAACRLYARNGFHCTGSRPVHSFGRDLVEQTWVKSLV
jgi:GNAT superfamily N-acetyltransferase